MASLIFEVCGIHARGQQQTPKKSQAEQQEQNDDVIRTSTELVQTGVSVLDRQGKFVEGLQKEVFDLKVDGKPVDVGFFELVVAGSARETAQLAAARGYSRAKVKDTTNETVAARLVDRGRVVVFFVDDVHIAFDSLKRTKDTINRFIDREIGQNDLVAVTSSSGQIGFLQQYTDNKEVLKMAVARLTYRDFGSRDIEQPVMTNGQALLIDRGDKDVLGYLVALTIKMTNSSPSLAAETVKRRARMLLQQASNLSKITLSTLETLARRSAGLPGRKLIFFISDGFPLDTRNSDTPDRIRSIADASIRSGVVIYAMDSRGLVTDMMDATIEVPFDPSGRMARAISAERSIGEDVLNALAADTGGRFIHNTNDLGPELTKALRETSAYYMLAWRPTEDGGGKKFHRIEVKLKNRPQLSVRVQRGYFATPEVEQKKKPTAAKAPTPAELLDQAINSLTPKQQLPMLLALNYVDTPAKGSTLVASMKIESTELKFEPQGDKTKAFVDIAGTVFDARGKAVDSFSHHLMVTPPSAAGGEPPDILYNQHTTLKPGVYQVRVAALDRASGRTGSATEWVEIPDLSKHGLSMSSLILGERKSSPREKDNNSDKLVGDGLVSVDHRFERSSNLRFLVYIYNAAHSAVASPQPNVALQVQILQGDQPVLTMPLRQLSTESQDVARVAYAAEIPLQELKAGQYVLQITAIDRIANANASRRVRFEVQ